MDKDASELIEKLAKAPRVEKFKAAGKAQRAKDFKSVGKGALAAGGIALGAYGIHRLLTRNLKEENKDPEEDKMHKDASALIQKLAAGSTVTNLRNPAGPTPGAMELLKKKKLPTAAVVDAKKEGSMKAIIDDIIKGAEQNTFGRPVQIQADTEWTPLDTAKTAGALQFLSEQGYSVKQAAEYLGLTEDGVQFILKAVG